MRSLSSSSLSVSQMSFLRQLIFPFLTGSCCGHDDVPISRYRALNYLVCIRCGPLFRNVIFHTTSSAHVRTSSHRSADQCFLKYAIFPMGSSTALPGEGQNIRINYVAGQRKWTHSHDVQFRLCCLFIIPVKFLCSGLQCWCKLFTLDPSCTRWPNFIQGLKHRNGKVKCCPTVWWKCLLHNIHILTMDN